jgi:hypothetical protein
MGSSFENGADITHHVDLNVMQIDESAYRQVKGGTHYILRRLRAYLEYRGMEFPSSVPTDTNKNVLMAAFYIMWKIDDNARAFTDDCDEQAMWWKNNYNTSRGKGAIADFKKKNCRVNEAIKVSFPQQKLYEAKKLDDVLYAPLHDAIIDSEFWTYDNTYDVDGTDINTILKNDVDQTEAAEVLTSVLNNFFTQNKIPTRAAVHSPDPELNSKTIINPGHPN